MKKPIAVRILAALGGLTLMAAGLGILGETFFHLPLTAWVGKVLGARTPLAVLAALLAAILLCTFGVCCVITPFIRRGGKRRGYVMQKGENGTIGVSVKSIEGLVQTCVQQYDMVESAEISVQERRDGIVILLNIEETAGINIPLAVGTLQKQIKQYVTTCTGVDVREVRVMVENSGEGPVESPFAVERPVLLTAALKAAEPQAEPAAAYAAEEPAAAPMPGMDVPAEAAAEEIPAEATEAEPEIGPAAEPVAAPLQVPVIPEMHDLLDEDDRPLHQRLFGAEEQPVFVPAPPELVIEPAAEEPAEEIAPETEAEEDVQAVAEEADAVAADAVLEVVEAIDYEEPQEEIAPEAEAAEEEAVPVEEGQIWAEDEIVQTEEILPEPEKTDMSQDPAWE